MINSPTETVVDIVLDVPEKFEGNVSALKFSVKLLAANMWFANYSGLKFSPDFQSIEKVSRGVLQ